MTTLKNIKCGLSKKFVDFNNQIKHTDVMSLKFPYVQRFKSLERPSCNDNCSVTVSATVLTSFDTRLSEYIYSEFSQFCIVARIYHLSIIYRILSTKHTECLTFQNNLKVLF